MSGPGDPRAGLVLDLGRALHLYGTPAHRLESALGDVASSLGLRVGVFSTPTALFVTFDGGSRRETHLARLPPSEVDLGRLGDVDVLAQRVVAGALEVEDARRELAAVLAAPPRYGALAKVLAAGLVSACFAALLRAGWSAVVLGGGCGVFLGGLSALLTRSPTLARLQELLGAFAVSLAASTLAPRLGASAQVVTLAGIILLVPGLTVTRAFSELAQGSLVSGTSRFFGSVLTFLMLGFGVLLGGRMAASLLLSSGPTLGTVSPSGDGIPVWAVYVAVITAGAAFTVLLGAALRDLPWIVVAGVSTFWISAEMSAAWGHEIGAFSAALAAGVGSNAYARIGRRPALIPRVPALLLLVPGSLGYRSVSSLIVEDAMAGVQSAFSVVLLVVALVAGLLAAGALVPVRRHL